jgi:ABC-2 type transport system ATP-binding protein
MLPAIMPALAIQDLHKRYGSREVVKGLSMRVERGQIYGLLGPNGSGKTTTLACALGLLAATAGSATVLGEAAQRLHRLKGRLGVVFDTAIALPGLSALDNLEYVRRLLGHSRGRKAAEVLEFVGLSDMAKERVRAMSLGQQKRLAIAGAFLGEPELLVLDEPLSGLDTMGVRRMLRLFRRLRDEGVTMVLSSHRLHEMQTVISHAGILYDGVIERSGSLDELLGVGLGRFLLGAASAERASGWLAAQDQIEVESETALADGRTLFALRIGQMQPEVLNRELVQQGVDVFRLDEQHVTLLDVFEGIVDGHDDRPERP